jgi:hypothetical protein
LHVYDGFVHKTFLDLPRIAVLVDSGGINGDDGRHLEPKEKTMQRREFVELLAAVGAGAMLGDAVSGEETANNPSEKKLIGMYVHECWVYNRPYAARSWTDEDWHGYLDGMNRLGFNLISIWPQLEIMPHPMTPSDLAKLDQLRRVIEMAHKEFGMKAWVILCPNNIPDDEYARRSTFENRSFSGAELRINPADPRAMDDLIARRERLLKPLSEMDGLVMIDSDPGGYPNSTNKEFVDLLVRHREILDRLRPGSIELVYWVWYEWQACGRYLATGEITDGAKLDFLETLALLKERNPEPWGLARGLDFATKLGLQSKVINFDYGAIECEPAFPTTNFGAHRGGAPYKAGQEMAPRGAMANAQTHCLQLPNTFAFVRGAQGLPLTDQDYIHFADDLISGQGERIFTAWKILGGTDSERMKQCAAELAPLVKAKLEPGPLKGLLFGDANRFINDLYVMLRLRAACWDFMNASEQNRPVVKPLAELVAWLDRWQITTGYQGWWGWACGGDIDSHFQKLGSPRLAEFYRNFCKNCMKTGEGTPMERATTGNYRNESETLRLIQTLKQTLWDMEPLS